MPPSIASALVALVALIQAGIMFVEIVLWNRPVVHDRLKYNEAEAQKVAPIVANAGLYNGFLAAGLVWGLLSAGRGAEIELFFLACVLVAGLFGAATLSPNTLFLQTLPAAAALAAVWLSRS